MTPLTAVLFDFAANPPMPAAERERLCAWLATVGAEPSDIKSGYVTASTEGYELRLLQYVRTDTGAHILVPFQNRAQTMERVINLGDQATWPGAQTNAKSSAGS